MAQTMISIRIEEELKKSMDAVCQELGLSMTTAFTIFAKQMVREQKIPFAISLVGAKGGCEKMTIDEQMSAIVNELLNEFGEGYVISRGELISLMVEHFQTASGSVMPSDYCYNRINNGITLVKPALFEFLGGGKYRCLGEHYCYNGPIIHRPKGSADDIVVGQCIDGDRILDQSFLDDIGGR